MTMFDHVLSTHILQVIHITIEEMEIENDASCGYDYLEIDGAPNHVRLCGSDADYTDADKYIVTTGNTARVSFFSDGDVNFKGFRLRYEFIDDEDDNTDDEEENTVSPGTGDEDQGNVY